MLPLSFPWPLAPPPTAHKKSSQKSHVPGGQRTANSSGSDWTRFTPACRADTHLSKGGRKLRSASGCVSRGRVASVPYEPLDRVASQPTLLFGLRLLHVVICLKLFVGCLGFSRIVAGVARSLFRGLGFSPGGSCRSIGRENRDHPRVGQGRLERNREKVDNSGELPKTWRHHPKRRCQQLHREMLMRTLTA